MAKSVKIQSTPNLIGKPRVSFKSEEFDALMWNQGYVVQISSAIKCPCKTKNNANLSTCENCLGVGWVFVNKTQDRAILSSINSDTKIKSWSEEKLGTVNVTLREITNLAYMDKIIVQDSDVLQSEVLYPKAFNSNYFSYTIYDVESVTEIFRFVAPDQPLELLEIITDYRFERNKIIIQNIPVADITALKAITGYSDQEKSLVNTVGDLYNFSSTSMAIPDDDLVVLPDDILVANPGRWLRIENFVLSIRYWHKLQYYVLDIPHTVRNNYRKNPATGREELQQLPVNGIARLSHYVVDGLNFDGDNIFDNSYDPDAIEGVTEGLGSMFIVS